MFAVLQLIDVVVLVLQARHGSSPPTCAMTTTLRAPAQRADLEPAVSAFKDAPTRPADWVINEFAHAALPDQRHCQRLQMMATAFAQKPTSPIPQACPNLAEAKAAYRFLENER